MPYASEGEGLYLPPVPEALNRCVLQKQVPDAAPPSDTIKHAAPRSPLPGLSTAGKVERYLTKGITHENGPNRDRGVADGRKRMGTVRVPRGSRR